MKLLVFISCILFQVSAYRQVSSRHLSVNRVHPVQSLSQKPLNFNDKPSNSIFDPFLEPKAIAASPVSSDLFSNLWTARISLLVVSALYGSNFGCVKILNHALDPSFAAAMRFSLAGLVFLPSLIKAKLSNKFQIPITAGLEIGLYSAIGYWAQAEALKTTSASTAAFICSLAVLVVPLLDLLLKPKKENGRSTMDTMVPALLATCGVACLELGGTELPGVGDLLAFVQPLAFGLGFWRVEEHMKGMRSSEETVAFTGVMMATVGLFSWLWVGFDSVHQGGDWVARIMTNFAHINDWTVVEAILWTGIITTALTCFIENASMKNLSASESTVIYSTEPLWGTAFASVALGEHIGKHQHLSCMSISTSNKH